MKRLLAVAALAASLAAIAAPVYEREVAEGIADYDAGRHAQALERFLPAAEAGSTSAQYHLGLMYARGEGVERDLAAAARWFERAARAGHGHSQYILGHMNAKGEGIARDPVRAHMWYTAAAANGWWKAREAREKLVDAGMSPDQVAQAARLYRETFGRPE